MWVLYKNCACHFYREGIKPGTEQERNGISIVATIKNDVWKLLPSGVALSFLVSRVLVQETVLLI